MWGVPNAIVKNFIVLISSIEMLVSYATNDRLVKHCYVKFLVVNKN